MRIKLTNHLVLLGGSFSVYQVISIDKLELPQSLEVSVSIYDLICDFVTPLRKKTLNSRKELQGSGVRLVNVLPGFVDTEGLQASLTDEKQAAVMREFGLGEARELLQARDKMLRPADVAETVWETINKPTNVYIQDVMIKDQLQSL